MKKLPIGISSFTEIRRDYGYYVDKTAFIEKMVDHGKYYFLSRPRRFGKSLLIDTLRQAFLAEKKYFTGLFLENHWDWTKEYPVIHLSFGSGVIENRQSLDIRIEELLRDNANTYGIQFDFSSLAGRFHELIKKLWEKYQRQVVILIDEYDKPILDNITRTTTALSVRDGLKNIYSVVKDCDQYLKFVLLTGVTKFSKVSLFSGLNNLTDITLDSRYSGICGYTHSELLNTFDERLAGVDIKRLQAWYNGYNFLGETVYNPYDILLYLDSGVFKNYWFETATPSFLLKLLREKKYYLPQLEHLEVTEEMLGSFDVEQISPETLLFQTGYLTITGIDDTLPGERIFALGYPNLEVKTSLNKHLLNDLLDHSVQKTKIQRDIYNALKNNQLDSLEGLFHSLFASIPYHWHTKNSINKYEGYYASVFYCYFAALGIDVTPEETTHHGRIDLVARLDDGVYLIEFKVITLDKDKGNALSQIKTKKYYEKYAHSGLKVFLIGVEFDSQEKNIVHFQWEWVNDG